MARLRTLSQISFFCSISLALFLLFSLFTSSPIREPFVVHEAIQQIPGSFIHHGPVNSDHQISLTISITSKNMSGLDREIETISDPAHPNYGKHLSKDKLKEFVQPESEALESVVKWLKANGVTGISSSSLGNNIKITLPASKANMLLNSTFGLYNDTRSGRALVRTKEYSLPASVSRLVQSVYPTVQFGHQTVKSPRVALPPSRILHSRDDDDDDDDLLGNCSNAITPQCVISLHNVPPSLLQESNSSGRMGLVHLSRLKLMDPRGTPVYLKKVRPDLALNSVGLEVVSIQGGDLPFANDDLNPDCAPFECDIGPTVESMLGIAPQVRMTVYTSDSDVLTQMDELLAMDDLPSALAVYSSDDETSFNSQSAQLLCDKYMQLVSRGLTVVAAVSDRDSNCTNIPPPQYPASCPHVTAVGNTDNTNQMADGFSQGSFSNFISMPTYQQEVVEKYLNQDPSIQARFNKSGRATPDVALVGDDIYTALGLDIQLSEDPSYSVAFFTAMIAAINVQRMNEGKPVLGFLNPLLYSNADSVFQDITQGGLSCAEGSSIPAVSGWDVLTGLGSPDISKLIDVLNS